MSIINFDKYFPAFKKYHFDATLTDMQTKIDAFAAGNLGTDSVGTLEIQNGSVTKAKLETAVQNTLDSVEGKEAVGVAASLVAGKEDTGVAASLVADKVTKNGVDGSFVVGGVTYTFTDGQIVSAV